MNNKGQVLILFVLIIPILLLGVTYIIDNIYISYHTNKLNGINSLVIKDAEINELDSEKIEKYIKKNDNDIEIELIKINENKIEIKLSKRIKSIFGIIIGKDSYTIKSSKTKVISNDNIPDYQ